MIAKLVAMLVSASVGLAWGQSDHGAHRLPEAGRSGSPTWTTAPLLVPTGGRGERGQLRLQPLNLSTSAVDVFSPTDDAEARPFPVSEGSVVISQPDPKVGNYHWVVARESRPGEERLASTVWYVSNPGPAPSRMLARSQTGLAIVPRLPREHGSYREGEKWDFAVRFDGQAVAGAVLKLETDFGTRTRGVADEDGVVSLVFPRDFDPARIAGAEHGGRASARFVVSAELDRNGTHYLSAFNGSYTPEPARSRNLLAGAGFVLLGMAAATPLLRRREDKQ